MAITKQSASKPLSLEKYGEGSQTIPKGSTSQISDGKGSPSASKVGGEDIVEIKRNVFIEKANVKHGNKFDYSKIKYVNAKTKVIITCPEHGDFEQTPDKHLQSKHACEKCWEMIRVGQKHNITNHSIARNITKEEFVKRSIEKYGAIYDFDFNNWTTYSEGLVKIKCKTHGWFEINPHTHLLKNNQTGCPKCGHEKKNKSKTKNWELAKSQFEEKHNNFYKYAESNESTYQNKKSKIKIICPIHGEFEKTGQHHLQGQGCFKCKIEKMIKDNILVGGYSEQLFKEKPELKDSPACLYYLEINNGKLFKIGISRKNNPDKRIKSLKSKAKKSGEDIIIKTHAFIQCSLYSAFLIEQSILSDFKNIRIFKSWSSELFSNNIFEEIKHYF